MDSIQLNASPREAGKKHARAIRRNHDVPCIVYGGALDTPVLFSVPELALRDLIYTAETRTADINVGGETYNAILKSIVMHPVTDRPYHVDFIALKRGELLTLNVALSTTGQAPATRAGLVVNQIMREIEITCMPRHIPAHIELDLTTLEGVHDAIRVSDLTMPEGVTTTLDPDTTLVAVVPPMAEEAEVTVDATDDAGANVPRVGDEDDDAAPADEA